jgi:hypothetical protein
MSIRLTEAEYRALLDDYCGVCVACGSVRENTEPDAEKYHCEECGEDKVYGVEVAFLTGRVEIETDEDDYSDNTDLDNPSAA